MNLKEKFNLIRKSTGLSQPKFGEMVSMPLSSVKKYSTGELSVSGDAILKIIEKFPQYTLWLTLNEVAPEVGQVSPEDNAPKMGSTGVPKKLIDDAFDKTIETSVALGWLTPKDGIEFSMLADLHRHNFVEAGGILLQLESELEQEKTG